MIVDDDNDYEKPDDDDGDVAHDNDDAVAADDGLSNLPYPYGLHPLAKWSLQGHAEFEGIASDLNDVVEEGTEGCQRKGRGEEGHVAELDEHLQVVLVGILILLIVS